MILVDNGPPARDIVTCGGGFDRVAADTKDMVAPDCERVAVGDAAVERLFERLDELGIEGKIIAGLAPFPYSSGNLPLLKGTRVRRAGALRSGPPHYVTIHRSDASRCVSQGAGEGRSLYVCPSRNIAHNTSTLLLAKAITAWWWPLPSARFLL